MSGVTLTLLGLAALGSVFVFFWALNRWLEWMDERERRDVEKLNRREGGDG